MTPEAQRAVQTFVASQKTAHGYMNAGGHEDAYYQQFGEVLEAVFTPRKLLTTNIRLTVQESRHKDTVYGRFFDFLNDEMTWSKGQGAWSKGQEFCLLKPHSLVLHSRRAACRWLRRRCS